VNQYRNDAAAREKQTQWITITFFENKKLKPASKKKHNCFYVDVYFIEPTHFGVC